MSKPKLNLLRLQFSLAGILVLTTAVAIYFAYNPVEFEEESLVQIEDLVSLTIDKTSSQNPFIVGEEIDSDEWVLESKTGFLRSKKQDVRLAGYLDEYPDVVEIELVVSSQQKLDFTFGLLIPDSTKVVEYVPRIETWDTALVATHVNDFAIVYETLPSKNRLAMRIIFERNSDWPSLTSRLGTMEIRELETDVVLLNDFTLDANPSRPAGSAPSMVEGFFFHNELGDLTIERFHVSEYLPEEDAKTDGQKQQKNAAK